MLKLLTAEQIRLADQFTIKQEPVASIDLMERASTAFALAFEARFSDKNKRISVYCGTGNNGGDGLAVARLLHGAGYQHVSVKIARFSHNYSPDFEANRQRLESTNIPVTEFEKAFDIQGEEAELIIDALLGTGLNKPLTGEWRLLIDFLNGLKKTVVSIDVPTGFKTEGVPEDTAAVIVSNLTITFQQPKLNFLLPESAPYIQEFSVVPIGLNEGFIQSTDSPYALLTDTDIALRLKKREAFSHKGTYGHALLVAGTEETMGAALLTTGASLYSGSGLTTACIPSGGLTALNARFPEAMAILRDKTEWNDIQWEKYTAAAVGPGLGTSAESKRTLEMVLKKISRPLVIDADAINLIAAHYELMQAVPEYSIFTPHVKEFDRLFGEHQSWWERLETGIDRAKTLGCTIVLKNRYTLIFTPAGECLFNPTGNPAMASGGMGDVLTGVITAFLAQGYTPVDAALLGVYIHGKAGDNLVRDKKIGVIPASGLLEEIPRVLAKFSA